MISCIVSIGIDLYGTIISRSNIALRTVITQSVTTNPRSDIVKFAESSRNVISILLASRNVGASIF